MPVLSGAAGDKRGYFDALYAAADDPYGLRERWYEQRKRAALLASLPHVRYRRAFEPGCGAGELTLALADRCDQLLASDFSERAVAVARQKVAHHPHVTVARQVLPADWPRAAQFDLIVLSEVGYFLDESALDAVAAACAEALAPGGVLVACDWLPDFAQRASTTAHVHGTLQRLGLPRLVRHEEADFVLQVWSRDGRSVAQQEGIR